MALSKIGLASAAFALALSVAPDARAEHEGAPYDRVPRGLRPRGFRAP